jgi:hypothetical protein
MITHKKDLVIGIVGRQIEGIRSREKAVFILRRGRYLPKEPVIKRMDL